MTRSLAPPPQPADLTGSHEGKIQFVLEDDETRRDETRREQRPAELQLTTLPVSVAPPLSHGL